MKKIIASLFFIVITTVSFSQDTLSSNDGAKFVKWSAAVRPIGFFDPFLNNFTGSVLYRFHDDFLAELDFGYIKTWYCYDINNQDNIKSSGYKIGGEIKYMPFKNIYFAAQVFNNNYSKTNREDVWRYGRHYMQKMELDKKIVVTGGHLKFGFLLHKPDHRFFMDFYGGIGLRNRKISIPHIPDDAEIIDTSSGFLNISDKDRVGSRISLSITLGVAVGLKLGK